jgi:hypothetical protein
MNEKQRKSRFKRRVVKNEWTSSNCLGNEKKVWATIQNYGFDLKLLFSDHQKVVSPHFSPLFCQKQSKKQGKCDISGEKGAFKPVGFAFVWCNRAFGVGKVAFAPVRQACKIGRKTCGVGGMLSCSEHWLSFLQELLSLRESRLTGCEDVDCCHSLLVYGDDRPDGNKIVPVEHPEIHNLPIDASHQADCRRHRPDADNPAAEIEQPADNVV